MNQTFDWKRWKMLVGRHWVENRKLYLLTVPAILGMLLVWNSFIILMDKTDPMVGFMQYTTYYTGLFFVGCLYASTIFADLGRPSQGIAWLGLPASHLEKFLCGLLFSVFIFFAAYTILFYLVEIPMVQLSNRINLQEHRVWPGGVPVGPEQVFNVFSGLSNMQEDRQYHFLLFLYLAVQSAFVLGSVYFRKYAFIKTSVAVLLFLLFLQVLMLRILDAFLPQGWHMNLAFQWNLDSWPAGSKSVQLPPIVSGLLILACYAMPLAFLIAAYFRLTEKEV